MRHNRNYLAHVAKIPGADSMTRDKIMEESENEVIHLGGRAEQRDYDVIMVIRDQKKYRDLATRDARNFNQKRVDIENRLVAQREEGSSNTNLHPLGKRSRERSPEEREWDQRNANLMIEKLDGLQMEIERLIELIKRGRGSQLKDLAVEALRQHRFMAELFEQQPNSRFVRKDIDAIIMSLNGLQESYEKAIDGGATQLKEFRRRCDDLVVAVNNFAGSETDQQHRAISEQLQQLTGDLGVFNPPNETVVMGKESLVKDVNELKLRLKEKAKSLSALLESQLQPAASPDKNDRVGEEALAAYKQDLELFCWNILKRYMRRSDVPPENVRLRNEQEAEQYLKQISGNIFKKETDMWRSQRLPWSEFKFHGATQEKVRSFIRKKMERLPPV